MINKSAWFGVNKFNAMLMSHETFKAYSRKTIPDMKNYAAAYYTFPVESIDRVNEIVEIGLKAGGTEPIPMIDIMASSRSLQKNLKTLSM